MGTPARPFTEALIGEFQKSDTWIHGVFALEQGFLFTSMLLSAAVVGVIERRWTVAAAWCAVAAVISATGLMHSYQWTDADTVLKLSPAWPFVIGYARWRRVLHGGLDDGTKRRSLIAFIDVAAGFSRPADVRLKADATEPRTPSRARAGRARAFSP